MKTGAAIRRGGALLLLAFSQAPACSVCGGPLPPQVLDAYLGMTLLLSLLPASLGAVLWWALRRARHSGDSLPP